MRPTIRSSMWSTIPTPWRAPISPARSSSSTSPSRSPFERHRARRARTRRPRPPGSSGASSGRVTSWKTSSRGGSSRSSIGAALGGAPPEVVVDRVGRRLGAALDRDAVLARVGDLLLAAHLPAAHRRDDLHLGIERDHRRLDPHLVVALAGAAVGDRVAAALARVLDRELGDQRPPERGEQRVAAAVERVGLDRGQHVVARELLARVDHVAVERAQVQRLALDHVVVLAGLAEVDGEGDDLGLVLVLDPLEHHARVEAARVEQQHPPDLAGLGLVGGGLDQRVALVAHRRRKLAAPTDAARAPRRSPSSLTVSGGSRRIVSGPVALTTRRCSSSSRRASSGAVRAREREHQAAPARTSRPQVAQAVGEPLALALARPREERRVVDDVEHGVRGRGDHRAAREGRAVVARLKHVRAARGRSTQAPIGRPPPSPLADRHDVGRTSALLPRPQRSRCGPSRTGSRRRSAARRARRRPRARRAAAPRSTGWMPRLALDRLDQHGRRAVARPRPSAPPRRRAGRP